MDKAVSEWIDYADNDLSAAVILRDSHKPPYEIIAYHSQQAAEKYLKALFVVHRQSIPRTHDLGVLLETLIPFYPQIEVLREICDRLTPFGVFTRYPGSSMAVGESHVEFLISAVEKVREEVLLLLKAE